MEICNSCQHYKIYLCSVFQDQYSLSSFLFLNFASTRKADGKEMLNLPRSWASQLRQYSLWIVDRRKSSLPLSRSQELFVTGNWLRSLACNNGELFGLA
jgi:hypothetical protein